MNPCRPLFVMAPSVPPHRLCRCGAVAQVLLGLLILTGCQSPREVPVAAPPVYHPIAAAIPPGVTEEALAPLPPGTLAKAGMSLAELLATLPRPAYLPAAASPQSAAVTETDTDEKDSIPLSAQESYAAGRTAWRAGNSGEALAALNNALRLAPQHPRLLALLGRIHLTTLNNRARGTVYLEQAVAADPGDVESLFLLGRSAWEQSQWDQAIVLMAQVVQNLPHRPADPGLPVLARHFLGAALERQGYLAAAVEAFTGYLQLNAAFTRTTVHLRELLLLQRQKDLLWRNVGDWQARLSNYVQAREAYRQAELADEGVPSSELTARQAYVLLRLGEIPTAVSKVVQYIQQSPQDARGLELVKYLMAHQVPGDLLLPRLQAMYDAGPRSQGLALAIADLSPPAQAQAVLESHLAFDPTAWEVFARILQHAQVTQGQGAAAALIATRLAIIATPGGAAQYAKALLQTLTPAQILAAGDAIPADQRDTAITQYLLGLAALRDKQESKARICFQNALRFPPGVEAARVELLSLFLAASEFDQARELLAQAPAITAELLPFHMQLLVVSRQYAQALAFLDQELRKRPQQPDLLFTKAIVLLNQRQGGDLQEAERLLLSVLESAPTFERAYATLFTLYDHNILPNSAKHRPVLLRRALQYIPAARLTRFKLAEEFLRSGNIQESRNLLENLLKDQPNDYAVLGLYLITLHRQGQTEQAQTLLRQRLAAGTPAPPLLEVAHAFYENTEQPDKALQIAEQLVALEPAGPRRDYRLALIYLQTNRLANAIDLLTQTLQHWPAATAPETETAQAGWTPDSDLPAGAAPGVKPGEGRAASAITVERCLSLLARALLRAGFTEKIDPLFSQAILQHPERQWEIRQEWATTLQRMNKYERADVQLQAILQHDPKHPQANNALGYSLIDRGLRVEEAQRMIKTALEQEPENPAYLDSLGWSYYKLGQFDQAVQQLTQARLRPGGDHPVILNHLGDALWRANRTGEAAGFWKVAKESIQPRMLEDDPEIAQTQQDLLRKLEDLAAGRVPVTAPILTKP